MISLNTSLKTLNQENYFDKIFNINPPLGKIYLNGYWEFTWFYAYEDNNTIEYYTNYDIYDFPNYLHILEITQNKYVKKPLDYFRDIETAYSNEAVVLLKNNLVFNNFVLPKKFSIKFIYEPIKDLANNEDTSILKITHNKSMDATNIGQNLFFIKKRSFANKNDLVIGLNYSQTANILEYNLDKEFELFTNYKIQIDLMGQEIFIYINEELTHKFQISASLHKIVKKSPCYLFMSDPWIKPALCNITHFSLNEEYGVKYNCIEISDKDSGNYILYNPTNPVTSVNYNTLTNNIELKIPPSDITALQNSIKTNLVNKNIDTNGLSIDYIVYWWKNKQESPYDDLNINRFNKNQRVIVKGKRYPNSYKINSNTNIANIFPSQDTPILIDTQEFKFGEYYILWTYRLKGLGKKNGINISTIDFEKYPMSTPQLNGLFDSNITNLYKTVNVSREYLESLPRKLSTTKNTNGDFELIIPNFQLRKLKINLMRKNIYNFNNGIFRIYLFSDNFKTNDYNETTFKNSFINKSLFIDENNVGIQYKEFSINNSEIVKVYSYFISGNNPNNDSFRFVSFNEEFTRDAQSSIGTETFPKELKLQVKIKTIQKRN